MNQGEGLTLLLRYTRMNLNAVMLILWESGWKRNGRMLMMFSVQVIDKMQFQVAVKEKHCSGQKKSLFLR